MKLLILSSLSALLFSTTTMASDFYDRALFIGEGQWQMLDQTGVVVASGAAKFTWEACGNMKGGHSTANLEGLTAFDSLYRFQVAQPLQPGEQRINPYAPAAGESVNPAVTDVLWLVDNNTENRFVKTGGQLSTGKSYVNKVVQQGVSNEEAGFIRDEMFVRTGKMVLGDGSVVFYNGILMKQNTTTAVCDRL